MAVKEELAEEFEQDFEDEDVEPSPAPSKFTPEEIAAFERTLPREVQLRLIDFPETAVEKLLASIYELPPEIRVPQLARVLNVKLAV